MNLISIKRNPVKKIKIKICESNRDNEFFKNHFIYKILEKYYDVELSENPDYLFYNDTSYEYLKYNCIRIFYTGPEFESEFQFVRLRFWI